MNTPQVSTPQNPLMAYIGAHPVIIAGLMLAVVVAFLIGIVVMFAVRLHRGGGGERIRGDGESTSACR